MERCSDEMTATDSLNESLLTPDTDFIMDDHSGMEVSDRLAHLEQRVQMQDDEIQLLKMTMADVLKRLNISEEQTTALSKRTSAKAARPASLVLPSRAAISTNASSLRKSLTMPSSSKTYNSSPAIRRTPGVNVKDSTSASTSSKPQITSSTTTCKKLLEIKPKEITSGVLVVLMLNSCSSPVFHLLYLHPAPLHLVTMQIYLSPTLRKTGRTDTAAGEVILQSSSCPPASGPERASEKNTEVEEKTLTFTSLLRKNPSVSPLYTPNYKSPIKSPSHYFQICY
ncbi:uncharacterized protein [Paramisgurnus dabryanus]|uniref:uncharacterized protein n=1 Tax=Paramisgurnus dabryanus TaxID=90735 RepID=UPI0031F350FC